MAEQVQALLDDMVGPLADLQSRGIFSESEIEQIVARRRDFEYRLRRRQPRQSDYLEYLETEEKLEELRRLRTRRLNQRHGHANGDHNITQHTNSKHIGDIHGIRFLHLLWIRTLRKFRSVEMYLQYAKFCERLQSYQRLAACYQDALSFFPQSIDLWIAAASHEFFVQKSMRAARILLQRAIRIHVSSSELWIQYFKLELHWICKLAGRKMILNETYDDALVIDAENDADGDRYKMAKIVYEEAIKSKATSPELPWQFVAACQDFPAKDLQQWIVEGLTHTSEDTWIIHANYLASQHIAIEKGNDDNNEEPSTKKQRSEDPVLALLENACQSIRTTKMFVKAIRFLDEYMENKQIDSENIQELQNKLFADATRQGLVNNELIDLQVDHMPPGEAISLLGIYTKKNSADSSLWIKYASFVRQEFDENKAAIVLETALTTIPINKTDYVVILVQLLGVRLGLEKDQNGDDTIAKLVQRLLLLAPASPMANCEEPLHEQAQHIPAVLDLYLDSLIKKDASKQAVIFESILSSKCMEEWVGHAPDFVDAIIDKILKMESCRKRQEVVFERAIRIFKDTPKADIYRSRRDNELRYRVSTTNNKFQVPSFRFESVTGRDIETAYRKFQVCYVKTAKTAPFTIDWKDVEPIFANLGNDDKASWCVENGAAQSVGCKPSPPDMFATSISDTRAYCSFLIQKDKNSYETTLQRLPFASFENLSWIYEPALWVFFGRNPPGNLPLEGRPEHTDSVYHDGTWHFQLSGRKHWYLRPTKELLAELVGDLGNGVEILVECNEGDILLVNTRLWFHRTEIPSQESPSVSYARDFRIDVSNGTTGPTTLMTNVDGLYATEDISAGCVIFTEDDMPDCELHRSNNPNCELVELEESGQRAVVSVQDIKSGEFFCVAESDSEDSDSDDSS